MGINIVTFVIIIEEADILHEPHGSNIGGGGSSPSGPMKSAPLASSILVRPLKEVASMQVDEHSNRSVCTETTGSQTM